MHLLTLGGTSTTEKAGVDSRKCIANQCYSPANGRLPTTTFLQPLVPATPDGVAKPIDPKVVELPEPPTHGAVASERGCGHHAVMGDFGRAVRGGDCGG